MILLHGESCNFSTTLPNMADGGKVYAFRSCHGRLRVCTAVARGSGTGDTNRGNLLLNFEANKSILGRCHLLHIEWKISGRRNHSVWMVWPSLDSLSATTLSWPGTCRALESLVSWYTRSRFSKVGHKAGLTCLLPCLCMTLLWWFFFLVFFSPFIPPFKKTPKQSEEQRGCKSQSAAFHNMSHLAGCIAKNTKKNQSLNIHNNTLTKLYTLCNSHFRVKQTFFYMYITT